MTEFFIVANSNAAPIVSDTSETYVEAETADGALVEFVAQYEHSFGLYSCNVYENADAYRKREEPLAKWRSKRAMAQEALRR